MRCPGNRLEGCPIVARAASPDRSRKSPFLGCRTFLALRGQASYVPDGGKPKIIGNLQQSADELKAIIKAEDWNQLHLIARGTTLIQILNGAVTSIVVDDDTANRKLGGLIGLQMLMGAPMKAEFRNIWLKKLAP